VRGAKVCPAYDKKLWGKKKGKKKEVRAGKRSYEPGTGWQKGVKSCALKDSEGKTSAVS